MRASKVRRIFGENVLVTGAASGLGYALALEFLKSGANVAFVDRDADRLDSIADDLPKGGSRHEFIVADVTNYESLTDAIQETQRDFGTLDCIVNNAGIGGTLPFAEATLEHWHRIMDLNTFGVIHGTQIAFALMREQGHGCIVNIASISGLIPFTGQSLYVTTKFAVAGLTLSLQPEARALGIEVILVCPGLIKTEIFRKPILGRPVPQDVDPTPDGSMEATAAAKVILSGVRRGSRVIIFPIKYRMMHYLYRLLPLTFLR